MAKAPKTLKQQYNSLRRKAEKMLALPENTGRGLKLPKVPKRITRKSVARMEDFNESIRQPNYMRKLLRNERRKEASLRARQQKAELAKAQRKREAELRKQDPLYQQKIKENRSKASKAYWERLKTESPELYKERIDALIKARTEGLKKYQERMRKLKSDNPEEYRRLTESARESRSRASKKYWEELRKDPEKFQERLSGMRKGLEEYREKVRRGEIEPPPRKLGKRTPREVIDQVDETIKDIQQVEEIETPEIEAPAIEAPTTESEDILKEAGKELQETVGEPQIPISSVDDIYEQFDDLTKELARQAEITTTGFAPGEKIDFGSGYDMGDEFELSPFEAIMVDRIYAENFDQRFAAFQHTAAKDMVELFQNVLADELGNMEEVRYIIAKSIENGDLEFSWGAHGDSTAKEIAEKMISALNKWINHQDPEFVVRHLGFNKPDFIKKIEAIAEDLDSGSPDWLVEESYDVGYWE